MKLPKDKARKFGRFHLVDPDDLTDVQDYADWLEALLHEPCAISEEDDGTLVLIEIKKLVDRVNGLKIEIYSNEHPPPHFHVKSSNLNAIFTIENCAVLKGKISSGDLKKVKYWHQSSKPLLIKVWNSTRPTNCVVGAYNGT